MKKSPSKTHSSPNTVKSRAVDCLGSSTFLDFQTASEREIWCLCTVTFGQESPKLNSKTVYNKILKSWYFTFTAAQRNCPFICSLASIWMCFDNWSRLQGYTDKFISSCIPKKKFVQRAFSSCNFNHSWFLWASNTLYSDKIP